MKRTDPMIPPPAWHSKLVTIGRMRENWIDDEGVMIPLGSEVIILGMVDHIEGASGDAEIDLILEYDAIALVAVSANGVTPGYFCAGIPVGLVEVTGRCQRLIEVTDRESYMHSREPVLYSAKTYYEEFRSPR